MATITEKPARRSRIRRLESHGATAALDDQLDRRCARSRRAIQFSWWHHRHRAAVAASDRWPPIIDG
jgi:hypothetical protein